MIDCKFDFAFDEFIFVGRGEQLNEIAGSFAIMNNKLFGDKSARKMKFFSFTDVLTAVSYMESTKHNKLCFMDDIFIQGNKIKQQVAQFINQAKNSKTTCVLTIHEPFGGESEKAVRNAANWYGMFNLNSNSLTRLTSYALSLDSPQMTEYIARAKYDKVLFYNTIEHKVFDNNYLPLLSVKNATK